MVLVPKDYAGMSDSQLYAELGLALTGGNLDSHNTEEIESIGYNYFTRNLPKIRDIICHSSATESFVNKDDVFGLANVIAEMISAYFKIPAATATIAMISARMGVRHLCPQIGK